MLLFDNSEGTVGSDKLYTCIQDKTAQTGSLLQQKVMKFQPRSLHDDDGDDPSYRFFAIICKEEVSAAEKKKIHTVRSCPLCSNEAV